MRWAAALLLLSTAARADLAWHVGLGAAWDVPVQSSPNDWQSGRARQDFGPSLLIQLEPSSRLLAQVEGILGGLATSQPMFAGVAARVGVQGTLPGSGVRAQLSVGAAFVNMTGPSRFECPTFGCDPLDGSGVAFSGEAALAIPWGRLAAMPFVQALLPQFEVRESIYPGNTPASVPLLLIGARLLL